MKGWLHRILDVPSNARGEELRAGFAAQLKSFHPDLCPDNADNRRRLGLIRVAHEVLKNNDYREEHEKTGRIPDTIESADSLREGLKEAGAVELAKGFLNAFQRERPQNGKNRVIRIDLSLDELIKGTSRLVDVRRSMACSCCSGSGSEKTPSPRRCHVCEATGTITWPGIVVRGMPCPFCDAKGIVVLHPCAACGGDGFELKEQPCRVTIPPGVPEAHRVVLSGEGERGQRGGKHGDLILRLYLEEGSEYRREGANLRIERRVEIGASFLELSHPDGLLKVPIPEGFGGGVLIASRHGLPLPGGRGERGDLKIHVRVEELAESVES